jgi:hypothetical protein
MRSDREVGIVLTSILALLLSGIEDAEERDYQLSITNEILRRGDRFIRMFEAEANQKRAEQGPSDQ